MYPVDDKVTLFECPASRGPTLHFRFRIAEKTWRLAGGKQNSFPFYHSLPLGEKWLAMPRFSGCVDARARVSIDVR